MSVLAEEELFVAAERGRIWPVFEDTAALARVLPGCERLEAAGPATYRGVLATKLQFLTIRADVTASLTDLHPPDHLQLELDGRPRGLTGGFRAIIPIDLVADASGTRIRYRLELTTSGRLASFGAPLLRDSFRRQVAMLVANLERELGRPDDAESDESGPDDAGPDDAGPGGHRPGATADAG
jgi:carbon monoxide dehydrogenase subunit G